MGGVTLIHRSYCIFYRGKSEVIQEAAAQQVVRDLSIRLALKIGPMLEGQAALRVHEEGTAEEPTGVD